MSLDSKGLALTFKKTAFVLHHFFGLDFIFAENHAFASHCFVI